MVTRGRTLDSRHWHRTVQGTGIMDGHETPFTPTQFNVASSSESGSRPDTLFYCQGDEYDARR